MSTATIAAIIDQVKLDVLSKTQIADNAIKRKEVSRSFICEPPQICLSAFLLTLFSRYYHRLSSKHLSYARNRVSVQYAVPTEGMLAYASLATLGDDVYFEPSTAFVHHIIIISSLFLFLISLL